jgi:hypothetical protein
MGSLSGSLCTGIALSIFHKRLEHRYAEDFKREFIKRYEPILEKELKDFGTKVLQDHSETITKESLEYRDKVLASASALDNAITAARAAMSNVESAMDRKPTLH